MAATYQIWLKNLAGARIAILDDIRYLTYTHKVNFPGTCQFSFDGNDAKAALFDVDFQVEVWRADLSNSIDWYLEWEGLLVTRLEQTEKNGKSSFTAFANGYLDLVSRRIIAYTAGSAFTGKNTAAETVVKEFVEENCGATATVALGRLAEGAFAGFTTQATAGGGSNWEGSRSFRNVLETIQEIVTGRLIDLDVIGTGAATFQFRTYAGQRGADRSTAGLVAETGLNGAGNTPIVFSLGFGNMSDVSLNRSNTNESNRILVLGQGQESERNIIVRNNLTAQGVSTWNVREATFSATQETTNTALEDIGDRELEERKAVKHLNFDVLQVQGALYGDDYTWGDLITGRYKTFEDNFIINELRATINENGSEVISVRLAEED